MSLLRSYTLLLLSLLLSVSATSQETPYRIYLGNEISDPLQELHDLCLTSLLENYNTLGLTAADLGTDHIEQVLENFWSEEVERLKSKDFRWFVAKHQNEIVGYASFALQNAPDEIVLQLLCVKPSFQGRGIGKELLRSISRVVEHPRKMVLVTRKANTSAISFYKHIGFIEVPFVTKGANIDTKLCTQLEIDFSLSNF